MEEELVPGLLVEEQSAMVEVSASEVVRQKEVLASVACQKEDEGWVVWE